MVTVEETVCLGDWEAVAEVLANTHQPRWNLSECRILLGNRESAGTYQKYHMDVPDIISAVKRVVRRKISRRWWILDFADSLRFGGKIEMG